MTTKKENCPAALGNPQGTKPLYGNSASSQRARILRHFSACPQLSTIHAREVLGILHPCGRIMELRKSGHMIDTFWVSAPDLNRVLHRVGLYVYLGMRKGVRYA